MNGFFMYIQMPQEGFRNKSILAYYTGFWLRVLACVVFESVTVRIGLEQIHTGKSLCESVPD